MSLCSSTELAETVLAAFLADFSSCAAISTLGASQAESVMEESRDYAQRSISQTQKIEETLREITTAIHEIQQQTESISQASTEQTATAHSVTKNVGHLKSLADDSVTETQGATDSINAMIVEAEQLSRVMGQFKV